MARTLIKKIKDSTDRETITSLCKDWLQDWLDRQKRLVSLAHSNVAYDDINNLFGTMRKFHTLTSQKHTTLTGICNSLIEKSNNPEMVKIDLSEITVPQDKFEREIIKHITKYGLNEPEKISEYINALEALADTRNVILKAQLTTLINSVTISPIVLKTSKVKVYSKKSKQKNRLN